MTSAGIASVGITSVGRASLGRGSAGRGSHGRDSVGKSSIGADLSNHPGNPRLSDTRYRSRHTSQDVEKVVNQINVQYDRLMAEVREYK